MSRALSPDAPPELDEDRLRALLGEHGGNVSHAAEAVGLTRQQLYRRLKVLRIDPANFRDGD